MDKDEDIAKKMWTYLQDRDKIDNLTILYRPSSKEYKKVSFCEI